jgi:hypothetical protein
VIVVVLEPSALVTVCVGADAHPVAGPARGTTAERGGHAAEQARDVEATPVMVTMVPLRALRLALALRLRVVTAPERVGQFLQVDRAIGVGVELREQTVRLRGVAVLPEGLIELGLADGAVAVAVNEREHLLAQRIAVDHHQRLLGAARSLRLHREQRVEGG